MAINLSIAEADNILRPRITVMGVGGAGGNAVNNMIRAQLEGCDFVAANTDAQALANSLAPRKLQLGMTQTRGLGAGSKPDAGRAAAEEQIADIMACLEQTDMVFVTAGMGGGTGTGAAPVIARAAREAGILTVGVVTKPFDFEGSRRRQMAEMGLAELQQYVDTLIIIPNQNLFRMANERTTFADAFRMADEVLHCGVRGITDLMVMPGFMNLDFADVKTVMAEMGKAMMGTGEAEGDNRALRAAEAAISNPLLEDTSMKGAKGVLINITGGMDMTLFEVDQAATRIREEVDPDAQIKVGSTLSESLTGIIRVSVIATGIEAMDMPQQQASTSGHQGLGGTRTMNVQPPSTVHTGRPNPFQTPPLAAASPPPFQTAATRQFMQPPQQQPATVQQPQPAMLPQAEAMAAPSPQQQASSYQQPAPPPQGPLRGQQMGSQFVAPRPVEAPRAPQTQTAATQQPAATNNQLPGLSPLAAPPRQPGLHNISPDPETQRGGARRAESLFTRITGFGMVRPSAEQEGAPAQQSLNIDRLNETDDDENLSDIPAFLRRQTNH